MLKIKKEKDKLQHKERQKQKLKLKEKHNKKLEMLKTKKEKDKKQHKEQQIMEELFLTYIRHLTYQLPQLELKRFFLLGLIQVLVGYHVIML